MQVAFAGERGKSSRHEDRGKEAPNSSAPARESGKKIGLEKNGANRIAQHEMGCRTPKRDQLNKIAHDLNASEKMLSLRT